jgi:hypothetical protein
MHQYIVSVRFERIAIDIAEPFPQSEQGNQCLLVTMDYFTKWPEACAIPNQEVSMVSEAALRMEWLKDKPCGRKCGCCQNRRKKCWSMHDVKVPFMRMITDIMARPLRKEETAVCL